MTLSSTLALFICEAVDSHNANVTLSSRLAFPFPHVGPKKEEKIH